MVRTLPAIESASFERIELDLETPFTIARGTQTSTTNHVVTVRDAAGTVGVGAAAPASYYDESPDSVEAVLPDLLDAVEEVGDPFAQQEIADRLASVAPDEAAARAAVSIAIHDLAARQRDEPLYRQWGLDPDRTPQSSYSVSIDDPDEMAAGAREAVAAGFATLKVKLGTDQDRERLTAVREAAPDARVRVDANCDWDPETALANLDWLAELDVEFLEQPVAGEDVDGLARVASEAPFPVAADESCVTAADVPAVADAVDIVVVKLMKCGGIRPAIRQIETARANGLDVMLGCMIECNPAIAGAAHLSPLVDYADLDGSLLLADDPWTGPVRSDGTIALADVARGTGVARGPGDSGGTGADRE